MLLVVGEDDDNGKQFPIDTVTVMAIAVSIFADKGGCLSFSFTNSLTRLVDAAANGWQFRRIMAY